MAALEAFLAAVGDELGATADDLERIVVRSEPDGVLPAVRVDVRVDFYLPHGALITRGWSFSLPAGVR